MKELETILYEKKDRVAWITMNRPKALNAQSALMRREVAEAMQAAGVDEEISVVVITGAGDRAFSAGADISEFVRQYPSDYMQTWGEITPYEIIRNIPKPVIAAVNGIALGGGCEMAMACDIIVASENAVFGQPEVNVGVIPGGGGTQVLPRLIGEKRAKELIFTGRSINAQEAYRLGLVNRVVPPDKLVETVNGLAHDMLKHSTVILKLAKTAVNKSLDVPLSVGMGCERELFAMCFGTEDQKEGSGSFLQKRKPQYKGK